MNLESASRHIERCAVEMDDLYGKTVFDEWAVVSVADRRIGLLSYKGPRKSGFQENFVKDAGNLLGGLLSPDHVVGDFDFARHRAGTGFEAFMVVGQGVFLICNNTVQSIDAIAKDPAWLAAQVPFVELSDRFRSDPVSVASAG